MGSGSRSLSGSQVIFERKNKSLSALAEIQQVASKLFILNTEYVTLMSQLSVLGRPALVHMVFSH